MIKVWHEGMSDKEAKDLAYFERNMMALYMAIHANENWHLFVELSRAQGSKIHDLDKPAPCGWYKHEGEGFEGWGRVISLFDGRVTFHVPDDFDLGKLPEIEPNWDGHSSEEKWRRIMKKCGCNVKGGV